jgi:hypothetical protein
MVKWLVAFGIVGAVMFFLVRSLQTSSLKAETFVETPEVYDKLYASALNGVPENTKMRTTPRVDVNAAESVIRWPAYQSKKVAAPPVELRIKKAQWVRQEAVRDPAFIGPESLSLQLDWPEDTEARRAAAASEDLTRLTYYRSHGGAADKDLLYDEEYRANRGVRYVTPMDTPREEAVLVRCAGGLGCFVKFEYLGRPAELQFPTRRYEKWEEGHNAAKRLLASIATPITARK